MIKKHCDTGCIADSSHCGNGAAYRFLGGCRDCWESVWTSPPADLGRFNMYGLPAMVHRFEDVPDVVVLEVRGEGIKVVNLHGMAICQAQQPRT